MPIYLDDRKLAKRLLGGDERAFNRFFDDNFARLYRCCGPGHVPDRPADEQGLVVFCSRYCGDFASGRWRWRDTGQ